MPGMLEGLTAPKKTLEDQLSTLAESQKAMFDALQSFIVASEEKAKQPAPQTLSSSILQGLDKGKDTLQNLLFPQGNAGANPGGLLSGMTKAASPAGLIAAGIKSVTPKEKPAIADMLALPVEHSMGYLLLYHKLEEIRQDIKTSKKGGKDAGGEGLGGIFKGLLSGAAGLALLAVSLIVFAGAMTLFGSIDWAPALAGLVSFGLFVTFMVAAAKELGDQIPQFIKFGLGVAILTGGLFLFAGAIKVMKLILPDIIEAIPGFVLFGAFVLGAVALANAITVGAPAFLAMSAGVLLLSVGLIAFSLAVKLMAGIGEFIGPATVNMLASLGIVATAALIAPILGFAGPLWAAGGVTFLVGALAWTGALAALALGSLLIAAATKTMVESLGIATMAVVLIPAVVLAGTLFAPAAILLSAGFVAWGLALLTLGAAGVALPNARKTMQESKSFLALAFDVIEDFSIIKAVKLAGFSVALGVFSASMLSFALAMKEMSKISENMPFAQAGLAAMMAFLSGVVTLADHTEKSVFKKVKAFGDSVEPISTALLSFITAMKSAATLKDGVEPAKQGIRSAMELLIGDGREGSPLYKQSIVALIESGPNAFKKVKAFGESMSPFSSALGEFVKVLKEVSSISRDSIENAVSSIGRIISFFGEVSKMIETSATKASKSAMEKFKVAVDDFAKGFESFMTMASNIGSKEKLLEPLSRAVASGLDVLKKVTDSPVNEKSVKNWVSGLGDISKGLDQLLKTGRDTSIITMLPGLVSQLDKIAGVNLSNTFTPLNDLLKKKDDLDKMTKSLEKMANVMKSQGGMALANFAGNIGANPEDIKSSAPSKLPSSATINDMVRAIYELMSKWDRMAPGTVATTAGSGAQGPSGFTAFVPVFAAANASGSAIPNGSALPYSGKK